MTHGRHCRHFWCSRYGFYCNCTKLVYIWPKKIVHTGKGVRPSEEAMFAQTVRNLSIILTQVEILGYVLVSDKVEPTYRENDFGSYVEYLRWVQEEARAKGDVTA